MMYICNTGPRDSWTETLPVSREQLEQLERLRSEDTPPPPPPPRPV